MPLGTKLFNYRSRKEISIEKLAFELGISNTAICKWESDKAKPSIDNLLKLCDFYETDIYQLLEDVSNINFSGAKFKGSSYVVYPNNSTINYSTSPEVINDLMENQKNIVQLLNQQNDLIVKLLKNE